MRLMITGAAGMLGQDVAAAASAAGHEPIALARTELDITDRDAVQAKLQDAKPDTVVNCAGWTDVDGSESEPDAAFAVNSAGAGNLARAASAADAWMIHISTDYVFDGTKLDPYVESDSTAPLSAYGRSKLAGELAVAEAAPHSHTTVRSSWLFGAGGPCFPATILRLAAERDELSVVADQVGCPTFTGHLAAALVALCDVRRHGVLHVASADQCSWFEFSRKIVDAAGLDCEVRPVPTSEMPRPATRPAYSVLRSERDAPALPDWRRGLEQYMALRVASR
jgi:dTDP-4-dehydrorhamnose reductase